MQTVMYAAISIAVLVIAGAVVLLVSGLLRELAKIGRTSEDLSSFLKAAEVELAATTKDVRTAISDVDRTVTGVNETVERVGRISAAVEGLLEGTHIAATAAKGFRSSSAGVISVYEGIKQGIRALWSSQETNKEGTTE